MNAISIHFFFIPKLLMDFIAIVFILPTMWVLKLQINIYSILFYSILFYCRFLSHLGLSLCYNCPRIVLNCPRSKIICTVFSHCDSGPK